MEAEKVALQQEKIKIQIMKAVRFHAYGGSELLQYEDCPCPTAGKGEVLIRVHAAGVNPVDWKIRQGYLKEYLHLSFPAIPGWDVSGVVEETGEGTSRFKKGEEVYGRLAFSRPGAYAEYAVAGESEIARKPKSIDHVHAAAIPIAALTAWQALFNLAELGVGQTILIHGAAGGVGSYAVQLAKWRGAYVIGTASKANHDFLEKLRIDEAVDYKTIRFEDVVHDVDVVFDTIGGEVQRQSWKVLKKGGMLVSTVEPPSPEEAASRGIRRALVSLRPDSPELAQIASLVDSGKLIAPVETILPLSEARRAHDLSQTGHARGKIVLCVI